MKTHGKSDNGWGLPNHGRKVFGIVGPALLLILINGYASVSGSKDGDPWPYNYNTGYPAVGGPTWGH